MYYKKNKITKPSAKMSTLQLSAYGGMIYIIMFKKVEDHQIVNELIQFKIKIT